MTVIAACHVHSEWSYDARWTLRDLADAFAERGYRVLLLAEHDRNFCSSRFRDFRAACVEASSRDMLVVPGIEYSDAENVVHIPTWGLNSFLGEGLPTLQLLEAVTANGGVAIFAHPARRKAWMHYDPSWIKHLAGIEVWNRKYDGWAPSSIAAGLQRASGLLPFVSLDFHERNQFFPLSMELNIAGTVTEQIVVNSIRAGHFQAAVLSGPAERFLSGWRRLLLTPAEQMRSFAASLRRSIRHFS